MIWIFHISCLSKVNQKNDFWISSEDIYKGSRWLLEISNELNASKAGIICLTQDNINSPWINFEAGALSKTLGNSYVCPYLFNLNPAISLWT
jgi:hypothetical protein